MDSLDHGVVVHRAAGLAQCRVRASNRINLTARPVAPVLLRRGRASKVADSGASAAFSGSSSTSAMLRCQMRPSRVEPAQGSRLGTHRRAGFELARVSAPCATCAVACRASSLLTQPGKIGFFPAKPVTLGVGDRAPSDATKCTRAAVVVASSGKNHPADVSTNALAGAGSVDGGASNSEADVRDDVLEYLERPPQLGADAAATRSAGEVSSSASLLSQVAEQQQQPEVYHAPKFLKWLPSGEDELRTINYSINLGLLLVLGAAALTKVVTVSSDQWGMLSLWDIVSRIPEDNWALYEAAVGSNPIFTKACISGVVYSLGDLTAQTYEGRSFDDFDRGRVLRSGICGFIAHGPLSHLYYENLDVFFTSTLQMDSESWTQPLAKVFVDQTVWSLFWNSCYYVLLGVLKFESPDTIIQTVRSSWWDLLKAGWRLWPFAHIITYGVIPVQHRLLWVDSIELVWVTILSLYGQQQRDKAAEAAAAAGMGEGVPVTQMSSALPGAAGQGGDAAEEILRSIASEREVVVEDGQGNRTVLDIGQMYEEQAKLKKAAAAAEAEAGTPKQQ